MSEENVQGYVCGRLPGDMSTGDCPEGEGINTHTDRQLFAGYTISSASSAKDLSRMLRVTGQRTSEY